MKRLHAPRVRQTLGTRGAHVTHEISILSSRETHDGVPIEGVKSGGIAIIQNAGVPFLFPRWDRVHNSCKRLSSARAARSPAFHAGVTCKSLHRNWGTCRHGRQRGSSRADGEKGPNLNRGKTTTFAPERDGTLSRVSTDLERGPFLRLFLRTLRDRLVSFVCGKRKQCAAIAHNHP